MTEIIVNIPNWLIVTLSIILLVYFCVNMIDSILKWKLFIAKKETENDATKGIGDV